MVTGHGEPAGSALVTHADVDMVSLTGVATHRQADRKGGVRDAEAVVHLELRGRAAVVVFDAADMKGALSTIDATGYYNAGQDCTAATRVLAGKSVSTKSSRAWPPRRKAYR